MSFLEKIMPKKKEDPLAIKARLEQQKSSLEREIKISTEELQALGADLSNLDGINKPTKSGYLRKLKLELQGVQDKLKIISEKEYKERGFTH